jgi:predicted RNA-binding protein with PIN domain
VATVLVDAENVRRSLWPNMPKDELVERCEAWAEANGHDVVVVWEGERTADDRIAGEVREVEPPVWVATSDRELRRRVEAHAERILGGGSFARELRALKHDD